MEAHNVPVRPSSDGEAIMKPALCPKSIVAATSDRQRNHSVLYPSSALSSFCYV